MYPEHLVSPMRGELTNIGFEEFIEPSQVEAHLKDHKGTTFVMINSVCGCAAGSARPGVKMALQNSAKKPSHLTTVFAGVDKEATQKLREFTAPYPPSSPSMALFKDGELVHFIERGHIEGRPAEMIGQHLIQVFNEFC